MEAILFLYRTAVLVFLILLITAFLSI